MVLRIAFEPFTVITLVAVLVFGVVVPTVERTYHISADNVGRPLIEREAEQKVQWAWNEAERCFEEDPRWMSGGGPRVVLRVTVLPSGVVYSVRVLESPAYADRLQMCLTRLVRTWRFSPAEGTRTVDVVFDPAQQAFDSLTE